MWQKLTLGNVIFVLIILIFSLITSSSGRRSTVFQYPESCSASTNNTFSWPSLNCVKCQWKQNDLPDSCPCPTEMREVNETELLSSSNSQDKCAFCLEEKVVYDEKHCLKCGTLNSFNSTSKKCNPCPAGHIEVIYNLDGTPSDTAQCQKCADGYHPSINLRSCVPCHSSFRVALQNLRSKKNSAQTAPPGVVSSNGTCFCPEKDYRVIDGVCLPVPDRNQRDPGILAFDTKNGFKLDYENDRFESSLLKEHVRLANILCKEYKQNQTACQILANLCTLNLHSYGIESRTTACDLYRKISSGGVTHTTPYAPALYYGEYETQVVLVGTPNTIPHQFNMDFSSRSSDINITLAKFSFDGKFLGLSDINEHIPCSDPPQVQGISRKFGATYKTQCEMGIQELWAKYKTQEMTFLDPYVSYRNGQSNELHLYNAPVKILNFKKNGMKVNLKDEMQWQLIYRFFMVDTIGGYEGLNKNGTPSHVRYVSEMHIKIQLQNSPDPGRIYVPLITLTYEDLSKEDFLRNELITFRFSVNYVMDMSRSLEDVKISIGVISALAVIWAAIQTWSWNRRNGRAEIDIETIGNLLIISCGHLADAFFIVCFGTALFYFIFFKKQAVVHVLLPDTQQEKLIRDLLISAFSLKIVDILKLLSRQSNIDIFFIDWERPKARSTIQSPNERNRGGGHDAEAKSEIGLGLYHDKNESVSIWRSYFVANEWNEIQTSRKVNIPVQIIASLFFLEIIGFKYWGLYWPEGTLRPGPEVEHIPFSTTARFAVATLVFGIIGILQWMYRLGFYERFIEDEIQDFVDLCTLGNISVFILAAKQHGYYIHGRSVHGFADTDMQTMIEQLNREEEDLCSRRGLLPQTDQQTFLISVPSTFRNVYSQVLQPLYASSTNATPFLGRGRQLSITTSKMSIGRSGAKPTANMLNLSIHAYHSMNRFLTAFLEHALSDLDYDVKDKSFFETTFDMEFGELGSDRAVFYTDNGHSFDSVLFYGNERTLFMFNLYTFIFVDILSHNFVLAGIVTFVIDMVIKCMRNYLGKRNLARKTLIDSRFLI